MINLEHNIESPPQISIPLNSMSTNLHNLFQDADIIFLIICQGSHTALTGKVCVPMNSLHLFRVGKLPNKFKYLRSFCRTYVVMVHNFRGCDAHGKLPALFSSRENEHCIESKIKGKPAGRFIMQRVGAQRQLILK